MAVKQLLLAFSALLLPFAAPAKDPYHLHQLSEREMLKIYQGLLRDGCHHADKFWTNAGFDPKAGFWGTGRSDNMNEGVRAISEMVLTCATLIKYSDQIPDAERAEYTGKALAAIRFNVATHVTGTQTCPDGKHWGNSWQSALWAGTMGFGSWLIWDKLDPALQKDVERVVGHEADRFLPDKPPAGSFNDTKAEENGWDLVCISLAANMFPDNPHASAWHEKALEYAMNTFSAPQDAHDENIVDGRPVKDWFTGPNLHSDFTLENHGFFHPSYIGCSSYFLTQMAMQCTYAHRPIPQAATHHLLDVWQMFKGILFDTGESAYPQGMDWELHNLPFINLYASLASYKHAPFAARLEQNFLQYERAWQIASHDGNLTLPGSKLDFTRHAICCEQNAYGFLAHKIFGPPVKAISTDKINPLEAGVRRYDEIEVITHRTENKFVSMSWTNRLMGLLIPIGPGHEGNPDFTVPMANGLIGSFDLEPAGNSKDNKPVVVEHSWKETPEGFETSGTLHLNGGRLKETLKLVSVGDKTVVYEDQVTALKDVTVLREHGVPLGIENDPITSGTRTLYYEGGKTVFDMHLPQPPFAISGSWANVDGRLGIVMATGSGLDYHQARDYTTGISVRTDVLYGSFNDKPRHFKAGELVARRLAFLYVGVSPKETAQLAKSTRELTKSAQILSGDGKPLLYYALPGGSNNFIELEPP